MLKIGTFGSCLSRGIAERYIEALGARLLSCVYHNRSDQYLDYFVRQALPEPHLVDLAAKCGLPTTCSYEDLKKEEFSEINILKNQCRSTMGFHMLSSGMQFHECLRTGDLDLLIIDNFVDAAGALRSYREGNREVRFFSRISPTLENGLTLVPKIDPRVAADNYAQMIEHFRSLSPHTTFVFVTFPHNTYPEESGRRQWTEEFFDSLFIGDTPTIPPLNVPEKFWTDVPSHYAKEFYYVYAGMISQIIDQKH